MKIRTGFVSNSSSSSFVCVIEKSAYDKQFETLKDYMKIVVDHFTSQPKKLGTIEVVMVAYYSTDGYCSPSIDSLPSEILEKVQKDMEDDDVEVTEYIDSFCSGIAGDFKIEHSDYR